MVISLCGLAPFAVMAGGAALGALQTMEEAKRAVEEAARRPGFLLVESKRPGEMENPGDVDRELHND